MASHTSDIIQANVINATTSINGGTLTGTTVTGTTVTGTTVTGTDFTATGDITTSGGNVVANAGRVSFRELRHGTSTDVTSGVHNPLDVSGASLVRCNGGGTFTFHSFTNGAAGQRLLIVSTTITNTIQFVNNSSTAVGAPILLGKASVPVDEVITATGAVQTLELYCNGTFWFLINRDLENIPYPISVTQSRFSCYLPSGSTSVTATGGGAIITSNAAENFVERYNIGGGSWDSAGGGDYFVPTPGLYLANGYARLTGVAAGMTNGGLTLQHSVTGGRISDSEDNLPAAPNNSLSLFGSRQFNMIAGEGIRMYVYIAGGANVAVLAANSDYVVGMDIIKLC